MDFSTLKALTIPEGDVKKIECNGSVLWAFVEESKYTNKVPISIDTDKNVYNGGLGYKNGYRLSSGGGESVAASCTVTGFIKAKAGDVIRIKGYRWYNTAVSLNYLIAYNSTFAKVYTGNANGTYQTSSLIASMNYDETTGISTVVLKSGISFEYIRISVNNSIAPDGKNLIVTINEEITE